MAFTEEQLERYSRHFVLSEIGVMGQKKLLNAKILVAGAGALGSAAMLYLAGAGIGTIGIADFDQVSLSNLQRQIIHNQSRIGIDKTKSAKESIQALNPDVNVVLHEVRLTPDNIIEIIRDYDFILDCTDRFETKFLINDACVLAKKPYCHAGVVRFGGQVMTYVPDLGPCLRCLLGEVPKNSVTCSEAGVLGAVTGIIGDIQALEAVKYITGAGDLLTGRVLYFDGLKMDFRVVKFPHKDKLCRICGDTPDIHSLKENEKEYEINGCG